ncbi:DNA primase family protein [Sinomonas sp. G460-2]|uniref:DNA primase family protein n=1 Tax=Sinomonas sp. G460-2 TaxID=3393464 RepID=UPI0039EEDCD1
MLDAAEKLGREIRPSGTDSKFRLNWLISCPGTGHARGDEEPSLLVTWDPETDKTLLFCRSRRDEDEALRLFGLSWSDTYHRGCPEEDLVGNGGWTDFGLRSHRRIASRFAQYAKGKLIYVHGIGWHHWDGKRWAPDHGNVKTDAMMQMILAESHNEAFGDTTGLLQDVKACMTDSGGKGVLSIASKDRHLFALETDTDPWLLNTPSGTIDLHDGSVYPHNPADRITKMTGASFDYDTRSEAWEAFLESSLPDPEVRAFLQRYVGMALVGKALEHVIAIGIGNTRNGKGVFTRAIAGALGDYAATATNDMLLLGRRGLGEKRSASENTAILDLRGVRWAEMGELPKGAKMNEALLKSLTGGDVIKARRMGKDFVEFVPSHTIFMHTNDLPGIDADSEAVWARVRIVPFPVSFRGREDKTLDDRLALEKEAILAWAVRGLGQYLEIGLAESAAVLAAGDSYRADNDPVSRFVAEACELDPRYWTSSADLRAAFSMWAYENEEEQISAKALGDALGRIRGLDKKSKKISQILTRGWSGIRPYTEVPLSSL